MSGHANFHTISGYTTLHLQAPPQLDGNVGVAGNQPVADDGGIGVGLEEEPRNVQNDVQAESSKALVRQLDILLARAAASATQSVDAKAVKAALNELGIPADKRKAIGAAAVKAQCTFMAINDFTGRQIAKSVSATGGKFDWNEKNAAGKAVKAAIDAQSELADLLRQTICEAHGGQASVLLDEAVMQCDRRTCEIQTLVCEFADLNEKANKAEPEVKARLDATLGKLLPRKALDMHGNPAMLETMLAAVKEQVEPFAKKLDGKPT